MNTLNKLSSLDSLAQNEETEVFELQFSKKARHNMLCRTLNKGQHKELEYEKARMLCFEVKSSTTFLAN